MKKSKIYTKGGDKGETSLVSGSRVSKSSHRLHIYGEVDELNSHLGLCASFMEANNLMEDELYFVYDIQSRLFDLGSNLACETEFIDKYKLPQIPDTLVQELEEKIDEIDSTLPALKNFILPGGHVLASSFHIARTICRRIERNLVSFDLEKENIIPNNSLIFINRLSDYLFVMARHANIVTKHKEMMWNKK